MFKLRHSLCKEEDVMDAGALATPEEDTKKSEDTKQKSEFGEEIEVDGKTYIVDKNTSEQIKKQEEMINKQNQTIANLTLQVEKKHPEQITAQPDQKVDWEGLIFSNPEQAVELIEKNILKKVDERDSNIKTELETKYEREQAEKKYWNEFYKDNKDLKDADFVVKAIFQQHWNELGPMTPNQASKRLAELSREAILKLVPSNDSKSVQVEGGATPSTKPSRTPEGEKIVTMGQIIRNRNKARREHKSILKK